MTKQQLEFKTDAGDAGKRVGEMAAGLKDARPLFKKLSETLATETEANFAAEGRPSWVPLSKRTLAERLKRNRGSTLLNILQDRGILAASVMAYYGANFAAVGAGGAARDYAAIQQLGGTIEHPAHSVKTRLRTDAKGNLVRQGTEGRAKNLAVFANSRQKRVRETVSEVAAYRSQILARPYLPFSGPPESATLQPQAVESVLSVLERFLSNGLK
jgi:phage gpG-like protein